MPLHFRTRRTLVRTLQAGLLACLTWAAPASAQVNNPPAAPITVIAFPKRSFVSATGYNVDDRVVVKVIHPSGAVVSTDPSQPLVPMDDPRAPIGAPFLGLVEVNHPGGACWFGNTPDMRAGDRVQIEIVGGPRAGRVDAMPVVDLRVGRAVQTGPDAIEVRGHAFDELGAPAALNAISLRLVSIGTPFGANGTRTLRALTQPAGAVIAPGDGDIKADPAAGPGAFVGTWVGLSDADIQTALAAIASVSWTTASGTASTAYEIGPGIALGPIAGCSAPLEILPPPPGSELIAPSVPAGLTATVTNLNQVHLAWQPSTDNVGVTSYGIYRNGVAIGSVQLPSGAAPAPTGYTDFNVPPGNYLYSVDASDLVGNRSALSAEVLVTAQPVPAAAVPVIEPPIAPVSILGFPSRDFVSSAGWLATDRVTVELIRGNRVIATVPGQIPVSTAGPLAQFEGFVEVNHPGSACWPGTTPEMRVGDIIRCTAYDPTGAVRTVQQTHVEGVSTELPVLVTPDDPLTPQGEGVVEIHGVAMDREGKPLPLGSLENRQVTTSSLFDLSGRRTLRSSTDGRLFYDATNNPLGSRFTAVYSGLGGDDVARILGGVSVTSGRTFTASMTRIHWLGTNPAALTEGTIYEHSDLNPPGPIPGCLSPLETLDVTPPTVPTSVLGAAVGLDSFNLTWSPSTDDWAVYHYRVYRDGLPLANVAATATSYLDTTVPPGNHTYQVQALDHASPLGAGLTPETLLASGFGRPWGNGSALSAAVTTLQADVTAPSVPTNLSVVLVNQRPLISWTASTDDVAVAGYRLYRALDTTGPLTALADVPGDATSFTDSTLAITADPTFYTYTVDAVDAAGNRSAQSSRAGVLLQPQPDLLPPGTPTGLATTTNPDVNGRNIFLSWNAPVDAVTGGATAAVVGYSVYRTRSAAIPPTRIAVVNAIPGIPPGHLDVNVAPGTYLYSVDAFDSNNNHSPVSAAVAGVVANTPPAAGHSLSPFYARDFVSAAGYSPAGNPYRFSVLRRGDVFAVSDTISVNPADPTRTIEVNHPGGTCWLTVTPDLVPGDVVRVTDAQGNVDQVTIAGVTAGRPIALSANSFKVQGTASSAAGTPLPVGQIEQRMITGTVGDLFDFSGARTLRGSVTYDSPGSVNWTAVYTGLGSDDMFRVMGGVDPLGKVWTPAESRGIWLGRDPGALNELTFFENGPGVLGGPPGAPSCTTPLQAPVPGAAIATAPISFGNVGAAGATATVTLNNPGGSTLLIQRVYISGMNPGDFTITTNANVASVVRGGSVTFQVRFAPLALGTRQAYLSIDCNAANTTDLSLPLTGFGVAAVAPAAPGVPVASIPNASAIKPVAGGGIANSLMPIRIKWAPSVVGAAAPAPTAYELQVSINSAAWINVPLQTLTSDSLRAELLMGTAAAPKTYQYRVRSVNAGVGAPAYSSWVVGPRFGFTMFDNPALAYGGKWTLTTDAGAYGGTVHSVATARNTVSLSGKTVFSIAGSILWVTTKGPDRGIATVVVDKGAPITVDLYAPVKQNAAIAFVASGLAPNVAHSITVNVLGTRNALSSGSRVDSDAILYLNGAAGTTPAIAVPAEPEFEPAPAALRFAPVFPNPTHASATLSFGLPRDGEVGLDIVDVAGRHVQNVHHGVLAAGQHVLAWDGRTSAGSQAAPGLYFAVLRFEQRSLVQRLVRIP